MSGLVLGSILLGLVLETVTILTMAREGYTGYRLTVLAVVCLAVIYAISRTRHLELAAILAVIGASGAVFLAGYGDPEWVSGGLFDYLIFPLWLGSLFVSLKRLAVLVLAMLTVVVIFPFIEPGISPEEIIVGPFTFVVITSVLLLIITYYRNRLELDRRVELLEEEERSRREAARADALLRVADRLNAQLDQDAVLKAIGEEVSHALGVPISIVALYDRGRNALCPAGGVGISQTVIQNLPALPRAAYDIIVRRKGMVLAESDLQSISYAPYLHAFIDLDVRSVAFASTEHEHELIGMVAAMTVGASREFNRDDLLLLQGIAAQAALALINTRSYRDARRRLERLQALRTIDIAITTNRNLRETLQVLLDKITEQLKVDAAAFLLWDQSQEYLEFANSTGFSSTILDSVRLLPGEGIAGRAAAQRKIIFIPDLQCDLQVTPYAAHLVHEGIVSVFSAPLIAQEKVKGVVELFHRTALTPDREWLDFFEALAGQAAIAIDSASLLEDLRQANTDLSNAYDATIEGWSRALDLRDRETEGHTRRVTKMTLTLAQASGFEGQALDHVRRGALLHDIGKMGVPDGILLKPDPLDEDEWQIMRRHPQFAQEMLSKIEYLKPALEIPYCHHEKWDGTGYPRGLRGTEIPLAARIFAVADVYDALTSDRPYRKAWSAQEAVAHIRSLAGTHFDPQAVELFLQCIETMTD